MAAVPVTSVLSIRDLNVEYRTGRGVARALRNINLDLPAGSFVGLVGESGSGKSTLALTLMGLLPRNAAASAHSVLFDGLPVGDIAGPEMGAKRGTALAMVFQDPMSALNPLFRVGTQMVEAQRRRHPGQPRKALLRRAAEMLARVGIPSPEARLRSYPHELSGGMRQRVMIAMALLVKPRILIADEPTTALDATVEAQIADLLREVRADIDGSVLFVSHSLGLVAELCDHVVVMYAGTIVESGPAADVFANPRHPYTRALLSCEIDPWAETESDALLQTIPGIVPDLVHPPSGCVFRDRCALAAEKCGEDPPDAMVGPEHLSRCWFA
jgi:peptide/nickel transport system ATP-binding protein